MSRTVFICINGILAKASDARGWTDEMVTALNLRTGCEVKAEKFEYDCSALLRWVGQPARARDLLRMVIEYSQANWRVVLIGHSNGCDLIARVMLNGARIDACHLFAPAAWEEDYAVAIAQRAVRRIHIYGSADDRALQAASISARFVRWLRLGYGSLGLRGPAFAALFPDVVSDHSQPAFGHSTWFLPGLRMQTTLSLILANDTSDQQPPKLTAHAPV